MSTNIVGVSNPPVGPEWTKLAFRVLGSKSREGLSAEVVVVAEEVVGVSKTSKGAVVTGRAILAGILAGLALAAAVATAAAFGAATGAFPAGAAAARCCNEACSICRINSKTSHPAPLAAALEVRGVAVPEAAADAAPEATFEGKMEEAADPPADVRPDGGGGGVLKT